MEKEQLYNCRTQLIEPDWSSFTALTIIGMSDYDGRSEITEGGCDNSFWCVFGIDHDGMLDPITDCTTQWMAGACAERLVEISNLPLKAFETLDT